MSEQGGTFDYVIVGAGSAGCVLAARLTEDAEASVALVEAGPPDTADEIHIPASFGQLMKSRYDWDLTSEPEPGLGGRRAYLPRGRTLGGSSSINAMVYIRGNRADYDEWAEEGATGWGYDDLLPYFKRSEDNERGEDMYHGVGGPLRVGESRSLHELGDVFVEAAKQAGHEANPDFNGARQEGVGRYQLTQRDGMRCSTADAFLRPAMERPNLTVITDALTTRILFEGDRAVGVELDRGGQLSELQAGREVILSAGAYNSPQILMLSGIGPAEELELLMIEPRQDLPVGHGLQDHLMVVMNWFTDRETLMSALTPENVELLEREGRGPLTSNVAEAGGFVRTRPGLPAPDVQFHNAPVMFHEEGLGAAFDHAFGVAPGIVKPTSRGRVTLRSAFPDAKPRVFNDFLATEEDRASLLAGIRMGLEISEQGPFREVTRGPHVVPASDSDDDIMDFVRREAMVIYHPTSTCAIGSVVDPELRVLGVDGLRVVDASVMPSVPRGNTNAPTIAIAERAADLIRGRAPAGAADQD